jgi:hypothetical protein
MMYQSRQVYFTEHFSRPCDRAGFPLPGAKVVPAVRTRYRRTPEPILRTQFRVGSQRGAIQAKPSRGYPEMLPPLPTLTSGNRLATVVYEHDEAISSSSILVAFCLRSRALPRSVWQDLVLREDRKARDVTFFDIQPFPMLERALRNLAHASGARGGLARPSSEFGPARRPRDKSYTSEQMLRGASPAWRTQIYALGDVARVASARATLHGRARV